MLDIKRWWKQRILTTEAPLEQDWAKAFASTPLVSRYSQEDKERLKELAVLFLHYKTVTASNDFEITQHIKLCIALQACVPILNLGLSWYDGWYTVIVYPGPFVKVGQTLDSFGVMHEGELALEGESWLQGPVIINWEQGQNAGEIDGQNLLIHEFSHKLDMLNGSANGLPPLHSNMPIQDWANAFNLAYADFQHKLEHNEPTPFNRYAATSPAEFFAVLSEVFFELPQFIHDHYPDVYQQLSMFYQQSPLQQLR